MNNRKKINTTSSSRHAARAGFLLLLVLIAAICLQGAEPKKSKHFTLENGLQVYLQERHQLPQVNIVFAVNVGSKDETPETSGIVHLLEHLILLGSTTSHRGRELINESRKKGAYLNAHTDHDVMTLEISLPSAFLDDALKIVEEKIFSLKFDQKEIEREKEVIIEEINRIVDDPVRFGTTLALQGLFREHPYGKPVFGDREVIKKASPEQLTAFYRKYFVPGNCAVSIVGDFDSAAAAAKIKAVFKNPLHRESFKGGGSEAKEKVSARKRQNSSAGFLSAPPLKKKIEVRREMDIERVYVIIALLAPPFNHKAYYAMDLLSYILGRGYNPLFNFAFRGRRRLAENVFTRYISLKYGGAFLIYMNVKPGNIQAAENAAIRFLKRTRSLHYSKKDFLQGYESSVFDYLESAKNRIRIRGEEANEKGLHSAVSYARYMLLAAGAKEMNYQGSIHEITSSHLREAAERYLCGKKYVVVSLAPHKKKKKK